MPGEWHHYTTEANTVYEYQAEILRIIDGDTLKARVDLGFYVHAEVTLRLGARQRPRDARPPRPARAGLCLPGAGAGHDAPRRHP